MLRRQKMGASPHLLIKCYSWICELHILWKTPSQTIRWKAIQEDTHCGPLASTCTFTHIYMHICIYTQKIWISSRLSHLGCGGCGPKLQLVMIYNKKIVLYLQWTQLLVVGFWVIVIWAQHNHQLFTPFLWLATPSWDKTTMETPVPNTLCQNMAGRCCSPPHSPSICNLIL